MRNLFAPYFLLVRFVAAVISSVSGIIRLREEFDEKNWNALHEKTSCQSLQIAGLVPQILVNFPTNRPLRGCPNQLSELRV
jgi:hypothetical protein